MATSTLPGGPADKGGAIYEILWGVHGMLDVVQERADSIRIEEPGVDGAEFYLTRRGIKEHWQTKRHVISQANWSLARLKSEGVLDFFKSCAAAGEKAVFASISDAPELRVLSDNARGARDFDEFRTSFLTPPRLKEFIELRSQLDNIPEREAFDFLLKVNVEGAREGTLEDLFLIPLITALFSGPPRSVLANLSTFYLTSVHKTLLRDEILGELKSRAGISLRIVATSADVRERLSGITSEYLAGQRAKLISGKAVPRKVASDIVDRIKDAGGSMDLLVASPAGGGKSGCFFQIASSLTATNIPVLAFRLDRLEPVVSTVALGEQLELTESPALVLARAYPDRAVVLIIDQLDFVSSTSGRHPDFFDTLAALCDEVRGLRTTHTIHLILACRLFDFENDFRFRRLLPVDEKPTKLEPFSSDEVKAVITAAGGDPGRLRPKQLDLLSLAQNLALFVDSKLVLQNSPSFITQKQLFDEYWNVKKKEAEAGHLGQGTLWSGVLTVLTNAMSERQDLSAPKALLDGFPATFVTTLVSAGVLTFNGRRYGFGHESFFDYCFARSAVSRPDEFAVFLEKDAQLLFRRAQLRQVLVYLREDDPPRYLANLRVVLESKEIRPHLKLLALELIAAAPDPTVEEFACLRPMLACELPHRKTKTINPDRLASRAWDIFFASRTLFPLADKLGLVSVWLGSSEAWLNDLAIVYLRWQLPRHADRVADLVAPFESQVEWQPRLQALVERGEMEKGRRYFDLVLRLLDRGILDQAKAPFYANGGFWTTVSDLAEHEPVWAAELAGHWLDRQIARAKADAGVTEEISIRIDDDSGVDDLDKAAKNAPAAVLNFIFPAVLRAAEALVRDYATEGMRWDQAWSGRFQSDDVDLSQAYLQACATAFASISVNSPPALRPFIDELAKHNLDTANGLLFAAFLCHPKDFADEALTLLASDPRRLHCTLHGSAYWLSRGLIEKCSSHCANSVFLRLESVLVNYAPADERGRDGYKIRGQAAYALCSALDQTRTLASTKTRLIEWKGKLGAPEGPPEVVRAHSVMSPITDEEASHMSDEQWLRAMTKYNARRSRTLEDYLKGGAGELAGMLGIFVAKEPKRFADLAHRFPPAAEPYYLCTVLVALKDSALAGLDKIAVARLAFNWPAPNAGWSALRLLGSIKDVVLPDDAVQFIRRMAFEGPGPIKERFFKKRAGGKEKERDIRLDAANTVRGEAIETIARLIFHDRTYFDFFAADIEKLADDPLASVRGCVAFAVCAMASRDAPRALKLLPAFFESDEALHSSQYVCKLVKNGLTGHLETLRPYVHRLLNSGNFEARRHGGIAACLARLSHPSEDGLVTAALTGSVEARRGAADVAESNLLDPRFRAWCEWALLRLFNDDDSKVKMAAAHCFWQLYKNPDHPLADYSALIGGFLKSAAFKEDPSFLLHALEETRTQLPEEILDVCEIFVDRCAAEARDISTGIAADEHMVGQLVFRAYAQIKSPAGQLRAIGVVDKMCVEGMDSAGKHLGEFER